MIYKIRNNYGNTYNYSGFVGRSAKGTIAVPAATATNNILSGIFGRGYNGTNGFNGGSTGSLRIVADEAFTDSTHLGTRLDFFAR